MRVRGSVVVLLAAGLMLPAIPPSPAAAAASVVRLSSNSADLDTFQFVDDKHQASADKSAANFLTFGEHRGGATSHGPEGTASAFVSQAATMETPGQPPFPLKPLNDIAVSGTSTSDATATGKGPAVPDADSDGSFEAEVDTTAPVLVFFSGSIHTANTDPKDSCSSVTVEVEGGSAFNGPFEAFTGDCEKTGPHQTSWAETATVPGNVELDIDVEYGTDIQDLVPDQPPSASASATVSLNMSFFPPTARFAHTLSGSTAAFDGSGSSANTASDHIAKWEWTFGDGKKITTTKPTVTHTYPGSPTNPRTFAVTLQVVDAGGSISPPVHDTIKGTAVTAQVKKKHSKLKVTAAVAPNRQGRSVVVTVARKKHGTFHVAATHHETLNSHSRVTASYPRLAAGTCQLVVRYPGDKTHLAAKRRKTFGC